MNNSYTCFPLITYFVCVMMCDCIHHIWMLLSFGKWCEHILIQFFLPKSLKTFFQNMVRGYTKASYTTLHKKYIIYIRPHQGSHCIYRCTLCRDVIIHCSLCREIFEITTLSYSCVYNVHFWIHHLKLCLTIVMMNDNFNSTHNTSF